MDLVATYPWSRSGLAELTPVCLILPQSPSPALALPLDCLLGQHPIASQKRHAAQDGQVLQGLEHVELSPVDIHEPQHSCKRSQNVPLIKADSTLGGRDLEAVTAGSGKRLHFQTSLFHLFYLMSESR